MTTASIQPERAAEAANIELPGVSRVGSKDLLGHWVVSVVMTQIIPSGINTQNKLYAVKANNRDEAHGKIIPLAHADYPNHGLHTICSVQISNIKFK